MKLKFFIGCLLIAVVASGATLGMAYCSGRWDVAIGPEIGFSKVMGLVVWIFGCFFLWLKFGKKGDYEKYLALGLSMMLSLSIALALIIFSSIYFSGRWDVTIGPEISFPKVMGLVVCILGCFILWLKFGKQGNFKTYMVLGLSVVLSLIFFSKTSSRLMVKVYAIGFEHAVFSAASPQQWSSVPMVMKKNTERLTERWISDHKKESNKESPPDFFGELPPDFVWKVFPLSPPTTPNQDKLVVFIQRGWSFDRVLEIGDLKSYDLGFKNIIYQTDYSNNISFLLIGGGD
jgi:hypothetical protein